MLYILSVCSGQKLFYRCFVLTSRHKSGKMKKFCSTTYNEPLNVSIRRIWYNWMIFFCRQRLSYLLNKPAWCVFNTVISIFEERETYCSVWEQNVSFVAHNKQLQETLLDCGIFDLSLCFSPSNSVIVWVSEWNTNSMSETKTCQIRDCVNFFWAQTDEMKLRVF